MAERKPAPGRVVIVPRFGGIGWLAVCEAGCPAPTDPLAWRYSNPDAANNGIRRHLRTEHADLWEACRRCAPINGIVWEPFRERYVRCPACHGRGSIERSRA